ncbi:LPPG:FO 2-phospho--lactate transferase (CofD) [Mycobacteroides abscessus subsp. massiliense]|nr:LPPG:FO 2-phospho--lactate transferase (CofD) [Mycobacteroides abscessus subsp. massiliense]
MYTLGGGVDPERGWGHRGETWNAMEELAAYGAQPDWFSLGDRDLATHLIRSQMLRAGYPLSAVTEALFAFVGADEAKAGPGVAEAIAEADAVLLAPSNPVVSVGAVLAVGGVRGALRTTTAPVIGYSPIVSGKPLRGMADECLRVIGVEVSSQGVGEHFGARSQTGILDGWLVDEGDAAHIAGVQVRSIPLLMTDPDATAAMVRAGLDLAGVTL